MQKIAISLSKGGVGKTTTTVNLGHGLAMAGKRVLIVDADTQGQCAVLLGVRPTAGLAAILQGEVDIQSVICSARPNLDILSGGRELAGVKRLIDRSEFGGEQIVREALKPLDGTYDFLLIDTSPGWDALTVNALFAADEVLAPVSLEALTLQSLLEFSQSLQSMARYHPSLKLRYVLPTFLDRRVAKSEEILRQLREHFPSQVCASIRYNVRLSEAPAYGHTIFEYAPNSPGAQDYKTLVERILQHDS